MKMLQIPLAATAGSSQGAAAILSLIGGLFLFALVLLLVWFATRWLGKRYSGGGQAGGTVQVLERTPLGQDKMLVVVRAGEQVWLLGVTSQHIDVISPLDPAAYPADQTPATGAKGRDFSAALQNALAGWTGGQKRRNGNKDE